MFWVLTFYQKYASHFTFTDCAILIKLSLFVFFCSVFIFLSLHFARISFLMFSVQKVFDDFFLFSPFLPSIFQKRSKKQELFFFFSFQGRDFYVFSSCFGKGTKNATCLYDWEHIRVEITEMWEIEEVKRGETKIMKNISVKLLSLTGLIVLSLLATGPALKTRR